MLAYNNISMFLMAVILVLLYSYLVYYFTPKNMISVSRARRYMVAGLMSPMLIFLFHFVFPGWGQPQSNDIFYAYLIYTFVQIGLLEEGSKYMTFQWVSTERTSEKHDLPIATMFYSMMSAVGFAITENVTYLIRVRNEIIDEIIYTLDKGVALNPFEVQQYLSESMMDVSLQRAISAVILHMVCGIIMGYFLAKAKQEKYSVHIMKEDDDYILSHPKFKRWLYVAFGIGLAAINHGIYNMNLMLPGNIWSGYFHYVNIFVCLVIGSVVIKSMISQSKNLRKTNLLKTTQDNETGGQVNDDSSH